MLNKIIMTILMAVAISACTTTFEKGEVDKGILEFTAEKRQIVLETGKSKKVHYWSQGSYSGYMYIVSTWKKDDGLYCRRMYEYFYKGIKEAELYNEWCRVGEKKWAINIR